MGVCFSKMGVCFSKMGVSFSKMGVCVSKMGGFFFRKWEFVLRKWEFLFSMVVKSSPGLSQSLLVIMMADVQMSCNEVGSWSVFLI